MTKQISEKEAALEKAKAELIKKEKTARHPSEGAE